MKIRLFFFKTENIFFLQFETRAKEVEKILEKTERFFFFGFEIKYTK